MHEQIKIAPSILSADFANLERDVSMISNAGADWIHVDVMDGHFVPNLTIGPAHVKMLKGVTSTPLDVHLMISNPEVQLPWYIEAGADLITIHIEACDDAVPLLQTIRDAKIMAGISLNPDTSTTAIEALLDKVDLVLVMSVYPGFGGQSFIESSIDKISEISRMCDRLNVSPYIEVDGGINITTAPRAAAAGANILVAGSAIFGAKDPAEELLRIKNACTSCDVRKPSKKLRNGVLPLIAARCATGARSMIS